jgi:hypothetical protein
MQLLAHNGGVDGDFSLRPWNATSRSAGILLDWFSFPFSARYPKLIEEGVALGCWNIRSALAGILSRAAWVNHPEVIERLLDQNDPGIDIAVTRHILSKPAWRGHPEWALKIIRRGSIESLTELASEVLTQPHWAEYPQVLRAFLLRSGRAEVRQLLVEVLSQEAWYSNHPELIDELLMTQKYGDLIIREFIPRIPESYPRRSVWLSAALNSSSCEALLKASH